VEGLLLALGQWLEVNGEAVYGTRHWEKFGEGPTVVEAGHFSEKTDKPFTARDYRFTQKPGALYAFALGWPGRSAVIRSLAAGCGIGPGRIREVSLLGGDGPLEWKQDHEGLHVALPARKPCDYAYALKLDLGAK
jgi:alpha-L-fucosidase